MGGLVEARSYSFVPAPWGWVGLAATAVGLSAVVLGADRALLRRELLQRSPAARDEVNPVLAAAAAQLAEYFSGQLRHFDLPCDLAGLSPFSGRVLGALRQIPYATTVSYGELALVAGHPGAARAIGGVMARNPLPLILPCHRVVAKSGALTGYSGGEGVVTKAWLLAFEAQQAQK